MPVCGYSGGKPMRVFVLAAAALLLSACANSIESRTAEGGGVGLAYMAPMRLLTVTATRAPPSDSQVVAAARTSLVAAEAELRAANNAHSDARDEAVAARALADAAPHIASLQTTATTKELAQATAQVRVTVATAAVVNARAMYQNLSNASRDQRAFDGALADLRASVVGLVAAQRALAATPDDTAAQQAVARIEAEVVRRRQIYERLLLHTGPLRETVEITMGPAVGDPNARFVANVSSNWFRSARGRLVVGQNGLLQSANLTVDGQLDEALVGVAQSIVALQSAGGRSSINALGFREMLAANRCNVNGDLVSSETDTIPRDLVPGPATLSIAFDPVRRADVQRVNMALCGAGFGYRIDVRDGDLERRREATGIEREFQQEARPRIIPAPPAQAEENPVMTPRFETMCGMTIGRGADLRRRCPGLVYRQSQPMNIDVIRFDNEARVRTYVERSFSFSVPNAAPVDVLRYDDAIFVTRRDDVGFVDGSLVSVDFDRPSEAAVAASIPFRIVRGATEALSELVQLRVNYTNQQTALTQAEQAAAAAQASGAPSAEVAQLESARRILELRLAVEQARQRLQEAEAQAATSD